MTRDTFTAAVQYDDWKGTAAADDADNTSLSAWLRTNGYADEGDVLVGVQMSVGENHGFHRDPVYVDFALVPLQGHPDIQSKIAHESDPVEIKHARAEMGLAEFVGLFKRFSVAVSLSSGRGGPGILDGHDVDWLGE